MENDCSVLKPIPYPYNPFEIEGKYWYECRRWNKHSIWTQIVNEWNIGNSSFYNKCVKCH